MKNKNKFLKSIGELKRLQHILKLYSARVVISNLTVLNINEWKLVTECVSKAIVKNNILKLFE